MKRLLLLTILLAFCATTAAAEPEKRPTKIWNRTGPLGETPKYVTDAYPLSDQQNKGGWIKFEPMTDEFEGKELDRSKWVVGMCWWQGRHPALFSDKNVTVSDGKLHLTMRKEKLPPEAEKQGYKGYTSAALHTKARTAYGYFEVKAKPMNSAGSSSFWFQQDDDPAWATEIDVFEIGGKAKGFENKYNLTLHVSKTPTEKKHWAVGGVWLAPWRLADDYHVYGLDWDKDELKFYVDGVVVRTVENTHWHQPLFLIFDSETMGDWMGMPKDEDLPSTFSVEYVRAWKKDDPIGRKLSERIGSWPADREKREGWKKEYERLTVDEKIRYCIFELRNESWCEFHFDWDYEPYSTEPEWNPRHELIKLGRAAIPQLLLALDSEVPTKAYPSRHMREPWLVRDSALNAIENIACRHFADNTELRELSDRNDKDRANLRKRVAEWWEKNKDFDEVHWAKEALLAVPTIYYENYGAGPRWWAAVDSLYRRLGKESNPLLGEAYLRIPKSIKVRESEVEQAQHVKLNILQKLLKTPTANVKSVFANALHDESLWVRIDGAAGLWAIGDASGLEPMLKEAEVLANGRGSPQFLTDGKGSFIDTGESELDAEFCNLVSFLVRCNTPASREAVYKCLRGRNPYLREKAINSVPSLRMEKAVRSLPELFDDLYMLRRSRPIGDLAAETFAKSVPDCPQFDGTTALSQQQSIEKIKQWWKENGPKLKWDEKRGVLVLPKKE